MTVERSREARFPIALWLVVGAVAVLYAPVLRGLVSDWTHDSNYSHGFLIIPAAIWMVWRDRAALQGSTGTPGGLGLPIVLLGLAVLFAGTLGAELFLTRSSLLIVLAGIVLFLFGGQVTRRLAFPISFLLLMIPLPAIVFNQIAFPLQILASRLGVGLLRSREHSGSAGRKRHYPQQHHARGRRSV